MAIFRMHKNKNFTVMSNLHLRDKELSLKGKGLLSIMVSLPEDWDYTIDGLTSLCKERKPTIIATLNELKEAGYLVIEKKMPGQSKNGRIDYEYNIYEIPQTRAENSSLEKTSVEQTSVENSTLELQALENRNQQNTNKQNTNKQNTYKRNKEKQNSPSESIYSRVSEILAFLNEKAHTAYRATTRKTQALIEARLKEGFTVEDFKKVISNKCTEWMGTEWEKFLRPETLFGTKFENYLNAPPRRAGQKASPYHFMEREKEDDLPF